ncbi:ABC transporter permease [Streptomyces sp. KK5PA1]|uniref:ABC transporter permease n=1 Tax=Actinacidiphila acididurans TaxID=2784346 RepID=A0ABS2TMA5_9ACTN|nr:ABC transporter permease [Actinacidiphila acididurans]
MRAWGRDLSLGARFAAGGGREGWIRTVLTAVGVGLGVALLLLAAAVPAMLNTRQDREEARDVFLGAPVTAATSRTLLAADGSTTYHGKDIAGVLLLAEGAQAPHPPGTRAVPAPGQMVVSPALKKLLAASPLLRARLPYRITGTILHAGLAGPAELYYYAGSDQLVARDAHGRGNAQRVDAFRNTNGPEMLGPTFQLLLVTMLVVLLLPVAVFIGTAVRLGGERRDARLAALRLVGADIAATRRIAAGEALAGALGGLLLGALFFLAGRQLAAHVTIHGISAYPADIRPGAALTVLVVLAVPAAAVAVTMLTLRGTVVEPLGVVRQSAVRRRALWWRLTVPALGLLLLAPLFGTVGTSGSGPGNVSTYQIAAGTVLLLCGVTALLPWLVETVVGRLRGGPVAWQLATRRLQLSSNASARLVSGVTVAVAGAIALQMLFAGVGDDFVHDTGADPARAQTMVSADIADGGRARTVTEAVAHTTGVTRSYGWITADATGADARRSPENALYVPLAVADCSILTQLATIGSCAPGGVYAVPMPGGEGPAMPSYARAGTRLDLNLPEGDTYTGQPRPWTVPAGVRPATTRADFFGNRFRGLLVTPQAIDVRALTEPTVQVAVRLAPGRPDAVEYLRNTAARLGVGTRVAPISITVTKRSYVQLRSGLFAGAALVMALIGASLLVTMLEQLRDRRKLLAVLVAFGTKRTVLAWSVLWQTALPVFLGLVLACAGGLGLGGALLALAGRPFHVDWGSVLGMSAIGSAVVLGVTLLSLPPLWRLMRADGLRTE